MTPTDAVYSPLQRLIHWTTAIFIFGLIPVGIAMHEMADPPALGANPALKGFLYEGHKSFGLLVLMLACWRVIVRFMHGAPEPVATLTPFERLASDWTHRALYVLIFAVPITGFVSTSMCCAPVNLFGVVPVPFRLTGSEAVYMKAFFAHKLLGISLGALVLAHAGAALMHLIVKKDGVFRRMVG